MASGRAGRSRLPLACLSVVEEDPEWGYDITGFFLTIGTRPREFWGATAILST